MNIHAILDITDCCGATIIQFGKIVQNSNPNYSNVVRLLERKILVTGNEKHKALIFVSTTRYIF